MGTWRSESIEWGPGFLAVVWFGSSPAPLPPFPVSKLSLFLSLPVCRRSSLLTGGGGKVWASEEPNHSTARSLALYKSFNTLCCRWLKNKFLHWRRGWRMHHWRRGPPQVRRERRTFPRGWRRKGRPAAPWEWRRRGRMDGSWRWRRTESAGIHICSLRTHIINCLHCKKKVIPSPAGMSLTKLSLSGNNLIIPGQGKFDKWHPSFYSVQTVVCICHITVDPANSSLASASSKNGPNNEIFSQLIHDRRLNQ